MKLVAKEWGDKTHISCSGGIFPDSQAIINLPFQDFALRWSKKVNDNQLIQNAFPELTVDEREFLVTGCPIGSGHWDDLFNETDY